MKSHLLEFRKYLRQKKHQKYVCLVLYCCKCDILYAYLFSVFLTRCVVSLPVLRVPVVVAGVVVLH